MKPLKFTKQHKKKLLEMCEKLYPEMYFGFTVIPTVGVEDEGLFYYPYRGRKKRYIHWFEFCMLHLSDVICNKAQKGVWANNTKIGFQNACLCLSNESYKSLRKRAHPVDYLYGLFIQTMKFKK